MASFAAFIATHRKEQEKDEASKSLSKSRSEVEAEEADVGEDNKSDEDHSSISSTSDKPKTLCQKRKTTSAKYPSKCTLAEAQLFFPTLDKTVHETGVDGKLIGSMENLPQYRDVYCCLFKGCD